MIIEYEVGKIQRSGCLDRLTIVADASSLFSFFPFLSA